MTTLANSTPCRHPGRLVTGIGLRLLIAAVDRWSAGSLLAVAMLHATFNASSELVRPQHDVARPGTAIALGAVAALVVTTRARTSKAR
jgi:hypothetical protein